MLELITYYLIFCFVAFLLCFLARSKSDKTYKVNGYKIRYNSYYKTWQTSHDEIGVCEEFKKLKEAKEYCRKG